MGLSRAAASQNHEKQRPPTRPDPPGCGHDIFPCHRSRTAPEMIRLNQPPYSRHWHINEILRSAVLRMWPRIVRMDRPTTRNANYFFVIFPDFGNDCRIRGRQRGFIPCPIHIGNSHTGIHPPDGFFSLQRCIKVSPVATDRKEIFFNVVRFNKYRPLCAKKIKLPQRI